MLYWTSTVTTADGVPIEPPYSQQDPRLRVARTVSIGSTNSNDSSGGGTKSCVCPDPQYRRVQSHRGKQRIRAFDYAALNVRTRLIIPC